MNTQYFLGIDLFTWNDLYDVESDMLQFYWDEIDNDMFQFYNVNFPFESMKRFNGMDITFQLEGTLQIFNEDGKVLWEGFPTQIEEFREMLLERM